MRKVFSLFIAVLIGAVVLSIKIKYPRVEYQIRQAAGQEKHDIFALAMAKADAQQVRTKEEFADALEALQNSLETGGSAQSTPSENGNGSRPQSDVERYYNKVSSEYNQSENAVNDFRARIQELDDQSNALFTEWENEAKTLPSDISTRSLRDLDESRKKYAAVYSELERSLEKAEGTLKSFRTYTIALKHLVNAETVAEVGGEYQQLSSDIESLIRQMDSSIKSTQEYLKNK